MKKAGYLLVGLLAGAILSTTAGVVTAQVKSLIGTKVSAEYTVTVNGEKLTDKAAIINNKAMVPIRSISETMGAKVKVESKSKAITVTTDSQVSISTDVKESQNEYVGQSKSALENTLKNIDEYQLPPLVEDRDRLNTAIAEAKEKGFEDFVIEKTQHLQKCEELIKSVETKRALVIEALEEIER